MILAAVVAVALTSGSADSALYRHTEPTEATELASSVRTTVVSLRTERAKRELSAIQTQFESLEERLRLAESAVRNQTRVNASHNVALKMQSSQFKQNMSETKAGYDATVDTLRKQVEKHPALDEAKRNKVEMAAAAHVLIRGLAGTERPKNCWLFGFARPKCKLGDVPSAVAEMQTLLDLPDIVERASALVNSSDALVNASESALAGAINLLSTAQKTLAYAEETKACPTFEHQIFLEQCFVQLAEDTMLSLESVWIVDTPTDVPKWSERVLARWRMQSKLPAGPRFMYLVMSFISFGVLVTMAYIFFVVWLFSGAAPAPAPAPALSPSVSSPSWRRAARCYPPPSLPLWPS